jgi:hypothetical protein
MKRRSGFSPRRRGESLRIDWLLVFGCSSVFPCVLWGEWFWVSISAIFGNTGNLLTIASRENLSPQIYADETQIRIFTAEARRKSRRSP